MTEHLGMLAGDRVFRIHWMPGSDTLVGVCHCGAERAAEEPVELWDWLLAHPDGHRPPHPVEPNPAPEVHEVVDGHRRQRPVEQPAPEVHAGAPA